MLADGPRAWQTAAKRVKYKALSDAPGWHHTMRQCPSVDHIVYGARTKKSSPNQQSMHDYDYGSMARRPYDEVGAELSVSAGMSK